MCGIIAYLGNQKVLPILLNGLYKLEYRGYDSAGIACILDDKIVIKNLNPKKRPISAVADNYEVRNATNIIIKANKKITFNLLYDKNNSLYKKIKIEQVRKETSNN